MLEAVDALVELLEAERQLLSDGRELPAELLKRIELAGSGVSQVVDRLRGLDPEPGDPEARRLKAALEERFVVAFRLARETEKLLRRPSGAAAPPPPPSAAGTRPHGGRLSLREVERRYREHLRPPGP